MQLEELKLRNFRNYKNADINFSNGVNVLIGQNAQGKTNMLEAIYFLALTKSHRTNSDRDLINWNAKSAQVLGELNKGGRQTELEVDISSKGKRAKTNHLEQAKLSSYIGDLNVILFAPEDLKIVKGSPQVRRHFMDMEFGQMSSRYLYNTTQYRLILRQRNAYLRKLHFNQEHDLVYLDVLTDQLTTYAAQIIFQRLQLLGKLQKWSQNIHKEISHGQEKLTFKYESAVPREQLVSERKIYDDLLQKFKLNQEKEIKHGSTIYGPHRDDLHFLVNGKDVATFGSQGQQRTTALSTKLAEIDLMKEETGEYPILLLDDVLSELDENRQTHLLKAIQDKVQTFITTTSLSGVATNLINNPKIFQIENGAVVSR